jgi:hypothetical protein
MKALLMDINFRETLKLYISRTVHAHADGVTETGCLALNPSPNPSYNRPPDPRKPSYPADAISAEKFHVESSQYHECNSCLIPNRYGTLICKRRAPFAVSETIDVNESGVYLVRRLISRINTYNPFIHSYALRCNGDIKLNTNGKDTKSSVWYCTGYATKGQGKTHNTSALLAKLREDDDPSPHVIDIRNHARHLLVRLMNKLNGLQEISAPMVIATMEGWAPSYTSHQYVSLYLPEILQLAREYSSPTTSYVYSLYSASNLLPDDNFAVPMERVTQ